jgi:hypothetical protein
VEGIVTNSKQPEIDGIDLDTPYDSLDRKASDLRGKPAYAEGILIREIVTAEQVTAYTQNRGAGTFYWLLDPFTGARAIAKPLMSVH